MSIRGRGRGGRGSGAGTSSQGGSAGLSQGQAKVYAITRQEAPVAPNMVTSIFPIYDHDAFVLIDPGSTCSFVFYEFALRVNGKIELLEYGLCVFMPTGGVVVVNLVMRACPLVVSGEILYAYLVIIKLDEFNVIWGMDWLSKHHVIMDCYTKEAVKDVEGQKKIVLVGERKVVATYLISAVTAFHLIRERCEAYLANVMDTT